MNWSDQAVLVTGGTGSFGKKFVEIMNPITTRLQVQCRYCGLFCTRSRLNSTSGPTTNNPISNQNDSVSSRQRNRYGIAPCAG